MHPDSRIRIVDPALFAELLHAAMQGESQEVVAAEIGISQGQLSRMLRQQGRWIQRGTYERLVAWIGSDDALLQQVATALLVPEAQDAAAAYSGWLLKRMAECNQAHLVHAEWSNARYLSFFSKPEERARRVEEVVAYVRREHPEIIQSYVVRAAGLGFLRSARPTGKRQHRRRDSPASRPTGGRRPTLDSLSARAVFGLHRAIEPLVAGDDTLGVELDCHHLTPAELARFLRLGLDRELILLRRGPDLPRIQATVAEWLD